MPSFGFRYYCQRQIRFCIVSPNEKVIDALKMVKNLLEMRLEGPVTVVIAAAATAVVAVALTPEEEVVGTY